ncbi:hypothetical protein HN777_00675 [Candidatus Woesearchaeota archaeon]|jgi:hypothetical protein|nr:hypothetical protein [Candidatus Woesearchaeota archaeon]MBT7402286.1 hypothetical protein [Candidatus Woesearchaeota archaeon]
MKVEFNPDGSLKLSDKVLQGREEYKKKISQAECNPKILAKLIEEDTHKCTWEFKLPETISFEVFVAITRWANAINNNKMCNVYLDKENDMIRARMTGPSKCLICRSFLNGLQTKVLDEESTLLKQANSCSHDFYVKFV